MFMYNQTLTYNDATFAKVLLLNAPKVLLTITGLFLYHKIIDVFVRVIGERDLFESGHSNFVHNLREGLIIVDDFLKEIKLINVAACCMLQMPNTDDSSNTLHFEQMRLKRIELGRQWTTEHEGEDIGNGISRVEELISIKDVVE